MKTKPFLLFVIFVLLLLFLSSCATSGVRLTDPTHTSPLPPTATPNPANDPKAKVVLDMIGKLNDGDIDGSLAHFSEDAKTYFIGMPPTGIEVYQGAEQLRPTWEYCVSDNFRWEAEVISVKGDIVTVNAHTYMGFTEGLGVAPNDFVDFYQVKDGKITNYASVMTEESLAEFKPALLAVMPPAQVEPVTSDPVSEITVTFENGTCTTSTPMALKAGELTVNTVIEDTDQEKYAILLFTLDEGKDMVDLMASTIRPSPPEWSDVLLLKELNPGETKTYKTLPLVEGNSVYIVCFAYPFELPTGNAGPFEVKP